MNRPAFFYKASFPGRQYLGYSHLEANPTTFFFQIIATLLAGRLKSRFTWFAHVVIFRLVDFFRDRNKEMNAHLPFAVVGSNDFVKVGSKSVRARQYPWGVVQGILHHFPVQAWTTQWKESFSKHLWIAFVVVFLAEMGRIPCCGRPESSSSNIW